MFGLADIQAQNYVSCKIFTVHFTGMMVNGFLSCVR